jgi:hypothetical protein
MSSSIIVATSRITACSIGGKEYSSEIYGDTISTETEEVTLKGSVTGGSDKVMHLAYSDNIPVLVCLHHGKKNYLPCPIGVGFITQVRPGSTTKHEFKVKFYIVFGFRGFTKAKTQATRGHCWIKRQFLRTHRLVPRTKNHMRCFMHCDLE